MTALARLLRKAARRRAVSADALAGAGGISAPLAEAILAGDLTRPPERFLAGAGRLLELPDAEIRAAIPLHLREAVAGSHEWTRELIIRALDAMQTAGGGPYRWPCAVFDDHVIVESPNSDKLTRFDYTIDADGAHLANPTPVQTTFTPVEMASETIAEAEAEAGAGAGGRWAVRVIRAGLSANGVFYPPEVLAEAAPGVDGAKVFAIPDEQHLRGRGKDVHSLVGRIVRPVFAESGGGEIRAELELIEPEGALGQKLLAASRRGMGAIMGLSIYGKGRGRAATVGGRRIRIAESVTVESVDIVVDPAAGGEILHLIESRGAQDMPFKQRMENLIRKRLGQARLDAIDANDDEQLELLYREAAAAEPNRSPPAPPAAPSGPSLEDVDRRIAEGVQLAEARQGAIAEIAGSGLPQPAVARLQERFRAAESIGDGDVAGAITAEREYLRSVSPGVPVTGLGEQIRLVEGREDKIAKMLDALWDPEDRSVISLKEVYTSLTGDRRVTGRLRDCDRAILAESIQIGTGAGAGVLAEVFGDSIARRMLAMYRRQSPWGWWERIATITNVMDFRTQRRIYWGGYGDLPTVAQGAEYTDLASPADAEETYSVAKRGGVEKVTLEAIKNDDLGQVQQIPVKLASAAQRTLSKFVSQFFTMASGAGPTMHDTRTLFHANHANRGTAALSAGAVTAARLAMIAQTEMSSGEELALMPRYLLVPWELEETAHNLFRRGANNDPTFANSLDLVVQPVPTWTDANDWVVAADPMDCPIIEVGFLDGAREPELYVQNSENVGSLFDSDQWSYKVRHIYGGSVLDWRGLYKSVVA